MSIWNYIGEFFLFRWLFDKFRKSTTEHYMHTEDLGASIDRNSKYLNGNHDEVAPINDHAVTDVGDNVIDESNDSEELDDLDIFMRDNNGNNHYSDYSDDYLYSNNGDEYLYSDHNDWDTESYDESYDDFLDEQDDYDMMDDDFYDEQDDYDMLDDDF